MSNDKILTQQEGKEFLNDTCPSANHIGNEFSEVAWWKISDQKNGRKKDVFLDV